MSWCGEPARSRPTTGSPPTAESQQSYPGPIIEPWDALSAGLARRATCRPDAPDDDALDRMIERVSRPAAAEAERIGCTPQRDQAERERSATCVGRRLREVGLEELGSDVVAGTLRQGGTAIGYYPVREATALVYLLDRL
jgi:hypothetical protein